MEDVFATDIEDMWTAISDPERLARWVAEIEGDLVPGGMVDATFTSGWEGTGRIDICEAPHRLVVTMSPGAEDETVIEAILTVEGALTRLVVEERGIPADEASAHGAGWQTHIEDLASYLNGQERGIWRERVMELKSTYEAMARDLG